MFGKSGKYEQPFYENPNAYTYAGIMSLAGCVLMVAATFLHWKTLFVKYTETDIGGFSILSSVRRGFDSMVTKDIDGTVTDRAFSIHGIAPIVFLVLYVAYILFMAYVSYTYHIQERDIFDRGQSNIFTERKKTVRAIMILISIILMIVLTHTKMFRETVNDNDQLYKSWKSMIEMSKNSGVPGARYMTTFYLVGLGKISYLVGIVLYTGSYIYRYVVDTLNEDNEDVQELKKTPEPEKAEESEDSDESDSDDSFEESPFNQKASIDEDLFDDSLT